MHPHYYYNAASDFHDILILIIFIIKANYKTFYL